MKYLKSIKQLIFVIMVLLPLCLFAQPPGFDDDVEDVPVDGGVTVLAVAAIAYGAKKLKGTLKNK